jgi:hypothetical protein
MILTSFDCIGLMDKLVPTLDNFLENVWDKSNPSVDVATAYAAKLVIPRERKREPHKTNSLLIDRLV